MGDAFKHPLNTIIEFFEKLLNRIRSKVNEIIVAINELLSVDLPGGGSFGLSLPTIPAISIPRLASGGMINGGGQLFIANEAGPELVGRMGNRTVVANNNQIVDGVAAGVARAISGVSTGGSGDTMVTVYLDNKQVAKAINKVKVNRGTQIFAGGVL